MPDRRYTVRLTRMAKRALTHDLPESVSIACFEFIAGPLSENPHRVGKQLGPPFWPQYSARRGEFRIVYTIVDDILVVTVVSIKRRRDVYHT